MKPKPNDWAYKSANAFDSYKELFLKDETKLAKLELKSSIRYAKQGADFENLLSIYLAKCSLNVAVGIDDRCEDYIKLQDLSDNKKLKNYYFFIRKKTTMLNPAYLDEKYRLFAKALKNNNFLQANKEIKNIKDPISKLLCISLLKDKADTQNIKQTIKKLSFYGYKKGIVYLLELLKSKTKDKKESKILQKKIKYLKKQQPL
jgi:hypothetical protein